MNSREYLEALGAALAKRVPIKERMDILRYYKEYFEDAGPEREAEIVRELGDPEALADKIAREGGFLTGDAAAEPPKQTRKRRVWPFVLAGSAALLIVLMAIGVPLVRVVLSNTVTTPGHATMDASVVPEAPTVPAAPAAPEVAAAPGTEGPAVTEFTEISVEIGLGDVTVQTGEGFDVSLSTTGQDKSGGKYELEHSVKNGRLRVWSTQKTFHADILDSLSAEAVITVPAEHMLTKIEVTTGLGDVHLRGLAGNELDAETGLGDITAQELGDARELSLNTGMGDVTLEGALALETDLETGMGDVKVQASCQESQCHYELESGLGEIRIDGRKRGNEVENTNSQAVYELDASTGMGDIKLDFA